jgi:hypothetical protein
VKGAVLGEEIISTDHCKGFRGGDNVSVLEMEPHVSA